MYLCRFLRVTHHLPPRLRLFARQAPLGLLILKAAHPVLQAIIARRLALQLFQDYVQLDHTRPHQRQYAQNAKLGLSRQLQDLQAARHAPEDRIAQLRACLP